MGGSDFSGQGLTGSGIRPSWDGTPIVYNHRNPDNYVVENYTVEDQLDPCGRQGTADSNNPGHFLGGQPLSPFYRPCNGTVGNMRRNMLIGPGLSQWDMTLAKNTKITERLNVELRWEVFNVLNRANFYYHPQNVLSTCSSVVGSTCASASGGNFGPISQTSDVSVG